MSTDTYYGQTHVQFQWSFLGDCGGLDDVIKGTLCPVTPAYGHPFAKTLNTVAGNQVSGTGVSSQLPTTMNITEVKVQIKVWNTAIYAGRARFFIRVGTQISYDAPFPPSAGTPGYVTSAAIARPGGGTWTKADLQAAEFGLEGMGDGPWNGTEGSGGEIRCRDFRLVVTYTTTAAPVADFSADKLVIFEGDSVQFTDLSSGAPTSWDWDFGDGTAHGTTQNPAHVYTTQPAPAPNNKVTVTLIATNAGGNNTKVKTDYITIWKTTDPITANFTGTPVTGDAPLTVQFTDSSTGYVTSWDWNFGDSSPHSTVQNPSHIYTTPGTYTVTLIASNIHVNDTKVRTGYITVTDPVPTPDFSGTPTSGQRPLTVVFTPTITNGKQVTSYLWTFGDGSTSILEAPSHIYTTPGTYTVSLVTGNAMGTHSVTKSNYITVSQQTVAAEFSAEPVKGFAPLAVQFRDLSTGDAVTWNWNFGDAATSTERHPAHTYRAAGSYTVTLVVNQGTGNTDTETKVAYITVLASTSYGRFMDDLKRDIMGDPEKTYCDSFSEFGGVAYVLNLVYERVCRFILETALLRKEATISSIITTGSKYRLPSDLIRLIRVEADSQRIEGMDQFQSDAYLGSWEATTGELLGYIYEPEDESLVMQLVPTQAVDPTLKVFYVYAPTRPTVPGDCFGGTWADMPIPYIFWWIIRYGVLSDLLKMEGPLYDIERAGACEELFGFGVEVTKAMMYQRNEDTNE